MADPIQRIPKTGSAMTLATRALIARLHAMQPEEFAPYAELLTVADITDQTQLVRLLMTARRYLLRTYRQVFDLVPGQGVLCLTERGKIGLGRKRRREIHTRARRTVEILQATNPTDLSSMERYLLVAELSVSAAVSLATHDKTVTQIEQQRTPSPVLINPNDFKDLFKGL